VRRRLLDVEIPGEHEAGERTWHVVRAAFAEHEPRPRPRRPVGPFALAAAVVGALVVVAVSPAGPALVRSVRSAVGVEHAEPALVALPAAGRLLVDSGAGSWIVGADGSKRLLGRYASSGWSPHGLFEVVTRGHELAAVDPKGNVRWSLERAGAVRDAAWSSDGYRIAYLAGRSLRVVAGDGTGDRLLAAAVAPVAPVWKPGADHVVTYVTTSGGVREVNADTGATIALRHPRARPTLLLWSHDGARLFAAARDVVDAAWAPGSPRLATVRYDAVHDRSTVELGSRTLFQGTGRIDGVSWSPDGRWLLLGWRTADQWVFAPVHRGARIRAVASISAQFHSHTFPRVRGWCC
jgi:WD40 repeat protein